MTRLLHHVDYRAGAVVSDLAEQGVLTPRRLRGGGGPALASLRARLHSIPGTLRALRPGKCLTDLESSAAAIAQRPAVETLDERALLAELRLWESTDAGTLRDGMQMLTVTLLVWMAADRLYAPYPDAQRLLVAGIRGNPTTEISVRLDELIEAARPVASTFAQPLAARDLLDLLATSSEGRAWLERFAAFLSFCGQRGPREFDLGAPRWSDDPTMVLDLVRLGLAEPERERVRARLERLARERNAAIADAIRAAPLWKRPLLRWAAKSVAAVLPLREAPKHYGLHIFQRMRLAAIELGRRLARAGVLDHADDVFFLTLGELESPARREDLAAQIEERRLQLADFHARAAPDFVRSDGVPVTESVRFEPNEGEWLGTGVSRGAASGTARVLDRPDPNAFDAGDVLVVAFADPGWTPLFPRASALIMEVGGVMCHAAVVARELGIPAVFGVTRATEILARGQRVSVDGSTGVVKMLDG
jgi:pyruvate,water dikinase